MALAEVCALRVKVCALRVLLVIICIIIIIYLFFFFLPFSLEFFHSFAFT